MDIRSRIKKKSRTFHAASGNCHKERRAIILGFDVDLRAQTKKKLDDVDTIFIGCSAVKLEKQEKHLYQSVFRILGSV